MRPIKKIETIKRYFPYIHLYNDINLTTLYNLGYLDYSLYLYYLKKYYKRIEKFYQTLQVKKLKKTKKLIKVKKVKKTVKRKIRLSKLWDRMEMVLEYYKREYDNLKFIEGAGELYNYYRYNRLPYFKLISKIPKLPDMNKKVRTYYVYALLQVINPSPSIVDLMKDEYVITRFVWGNKQKLKTNKLIDILIKTPANVKNWDGSYRPRIDAILTEKFLNSKKYRYIDFIGIRFDK